MRLLVPLLCLSGFLLLTPKPAFAETPATKYLPASVVLYAETSATGDLLSDILDHPQRKQVESLPQYREWLKSEDYRKLQFVLKLVESQLGAPWRESIEHLGAGGIHVAFDAASQGVAILVESDDKLMLEKAKNAVVNLSLMSAAGKRRSTPLKITEYRGVEAYRAEKARFAILDHWLVLTNSSELGKNILDRMLDGSTDSLADHRQFQTAIASRPGNARAWAYADLKTLRNAGVAKQLLSGKSENPGAELLAGGILNTLTHAPFATAHLTSHEGSLKLTASVPHDKSWTPAEREFFFGQNDTGSAPPVVELPDTIAEVRAYRGVSGMWLHGPDLFDEEANAALAKANSNLSTVFGGRPFAEEILGALDGGLRLVAVRENHRLQVDNQATIKLPGFAAVARLKDPDSTQRPLRIAFQTAVGFANLIGAQEGRPPLELETQRNNGQVLMSAYYSPDDLLDEDEMAMAANGAGVLMQLSPTVAFADDLVVVASTNSLASKILDKLANESNPSSATPTDSAVTNSALLIHAGPLRKTLAENRERLITNSMLEKGHDRAAAEQEIDGLLMILQFFQQADAKLRVGGQQLELSIHLTAAQE